MSWTEILPHRASPKVAAAVTVKIAKATAASKRRRLFISIRPDLIEGGLAWCTDKAACSVLAGAGEHHGHIMIKAKGPHTLCVVGQRGATARVTVVVDVPASVRGDLAETNRVSAEYDWNTDWLDLELSAEWLTAKSREAALPIPPSSPRPAAGTPYRGLATLGKAPANLVGGR